MSSVDERIVSMQFDNKQFESGVAQTMKSLESLKKSLKMNDSGESFDKLQNAVNAFSLAKISSGIDSLEKRFSIMGTIGARVLENLADRVYRLGESFVKSVTVDQISAGFSKYEEKTRAVQTIVNATGASMEEVDKQLSKLAWFTDETSYNFVDMTSNIGKFTSMGVDLETSVTAMQGIATWAAVSGQGVNEASRAMYNLSQAIGVGSVKLMDWRSIENANMGTAEFKNQVIAAAKALGKLNAEGKTSKGTLVTVENFSSTLSEEWLTKDVLLNTLSKYGEYADAVYKVAAEKGISAAEAMELVSGETMQLGEKAFKAAQEAKTFSEAIDSVKDAASSGFMSIFESIFGNYEEAKVVWTDLANYLWDMFASPVSDMADVFAEWKELGGRSDFLDGIYSSFDAFANIVQVVKDAFHNLFPPTTADNLMAISSAIQDAGEKLNAFFGVTQKIRRTISDSGDITKTADAAQKITEAFGGKLEVGATGDEVAKLQKRLVDLNYDLGKSGADGIYGPKTKAAIEKFEKDYGLAIDGVWDENNHTKILELLNSETKAVQEFSGSLEKGARGEAVAEVQKQLEQLGYSLGDAGADGIYGPKTKEAIEKFEKDYGLAVDGVWDESDYKQVLDILGDATKTTGTLNQYEEEIITRFKNSKLQNIVNGLVSGLHIISSALKTIWGFGKAILNALSPLGDMFLTLASALGLWVTGVDNTLTETGFWESAVENFTKALGPFSEAVKFAASAVLDFFGLGNGSSKITVTFQTLKDKFTAFKDSVKETGWFKTIKKSFEGLKSSIKKNVSPALSKAFSDVKTYLGPKFQAIVSKVQEKLPAVMEWLGVFFGKILDWASEFAGKIPGYISKIKDFFSTLFSGGKGGIGGKVGGAWSGIVEFLTNLKDAIVGFFTADTSGSKGFIDALKKRLEPFARFGGWVAKVFGSLGGIFSGLLEIANEFVSNAGPTGLAGAFALGLIGYGGAKILSLVSTAKDAIGTLQGLFSDLRKKVKKQESTATSVLKFAIAIGIIAAAIYAIGSMDAASLAKGVIVVAAIALVLGALVAFAKFKVTNNDRKKFSALAQLFLYFGIAIGIIAASILVLGLMPLHALIQGGVAVVIIIGIIIGTMALMKKLGLSVGNVTIAVSGMIQLAVAIGILALIAVLLGYTKWKKTLVGMGFVLALLGMMAGFIILVSRFGKTSNFKVAGLLAVAFAVGILAIIAVLLGKNNWKETLLGMVWVLVLLGMLVGFVILVSRVGKTSNFKVVGLIAVAVAVAILAAVAVILGKLNQGEVWRGIGAVAALAIIVGGLAVVFGLFSKGIAIGPTLVVLIGIIAVMIVFAIVIKMVSDVDPSILYAFSISLGIALIALIGAFALAGAFKEVVGAGAAIILAIIVVALILVAIVGAIDNAIGGGGGLLEAVNRGAAVFEALGKALGGFFGGIVSGFLEVVSGALELLGEAVENMLTNFADGMTTLSDALVTVKDTISGFSDEEGLDEDLTAALAFMTSIKNFLTSLGTFVIDWNAIPLLMSGSEAFEQDITNFVSAIGIAKTGLSGIGGEDSTLEADVTAALAAASLLKTFVDGLGSRFVLWNNLGLWQTGSEAFEDDVTAFTNAISTLSSGLSGLSSEDSTFGTDVMAALGAAMALKTFTVGLGSRFVLWNNLGLWQTGSEAFADDVIAFTGAIGTAATSLSGIGGEDSTFSSDVTAALGAASSLKTFFDGLADPPSWTNISSWFSKDKESEFSSDIDDFATAMSGVSTSLSTIDSDGLFQTNVGNALTAAGKIGEFLTGLTEVNLDDRTGLQRFLGVKSDSENIFSQMQQFAQSMVGISTTLAPLDSEEGGFQSRLDAALAGAKALGEFLADISEGDGVDTSGLFHTSNFSKLRGQMADLGTTINQFYSNMGDVDVEQFQSISASLTGWMNSLISLSTSYDGSLDVSNIFGSAYEDLVNVLSGKDTKGLKVSNILGGISPDEIQTYLSGFNGMDTSGIDSLMTSLQGATGDASALGEDVVNSVAEGITAAPISSALSSAIRSAVSFAGVGNSVNLGSRIAQGVASGISGSSYKIKSALISAISSAVQSAKDYSEVNSPSKLFAREVGSPISEGIAYGIERNSYYVDDALHSLVLGAGDTTGHILAAMSQAMLEDVNAEPVIRPVVDMSNVSQSAQTINGMLSSSHRIGLSTDQSQRLASDTASSITASKANQNGTLTASKTVNNDSSSTVNVSGNFYVRNDQDIRSLASEIATLTKRQQVSFGS